MLHFSNNCGCFCFAEQKSKKNTKYFVYGEGFINILFSQTPSIDESVDTMSDIVEPVGPSDFESAENGANEVRTAVVRYSQVYYVVRNNIYNKFLV